MSRYLLPALLGLLLTACAHQPPNTAQPAPVPMTPPAAAVVEPVTPPPAPTPAPPAPAPARPVPAENGMALLQKALPPGIPERQGWAADMQAAFINLKIPQTRENYCALAAVIEQESSWQSDPVVPGLPAIVWGKIDEKAQRYFVPLTVVKAALLKPSPDGRSYKARIDALRTEREMNALFEDMAHEAKRLGLPFDMKNPIRTGGPMQVSVEFAESHAKAWRYPYSQRDSIRHQVFTRRGGVYFGAAILLQYPAPYPQMLYRFADFNAGRYASRNAAFQAAVAKLTGSKLQQDGDLVDYRGGKRSASERATLALAPRVAMSATAIERDLKQEKSAAFGQSELYRKLFALADAALGQAQPRELLPQIALVSPKISRKLTTEWFAKRVDGRYQRCLARVGS